MKNIIDILKNTKPFAYGYFASILFVAVLSLFFTQSYNLFYQFSFISFFTSLFFIYFIVLIALTAGLVYFLKQKVKDGDYRFKFLATFLPVLFGYIMYPLSFYTYLFLSTLPRDTFSSYVYILNTFLIPTLFYLLFIVILVFLLNMIKTKSYKIKALFGIFFIVNMIIGQSISALSFLLSSILFPLAIIIRNVLRERSFSDSGLGEFSESLGGIFSISVLPYPSQVLYYMFAVSKFDYYPDSNLHFYYNILVFVFILAPVFILPLFIKNKKAVEK